VKARRTAENGLLRAEGVGSFAAVFRSNFQRGGEKDERSSLKQHATAFPELEKTMIQ